MLPRAARDQYDAQKAIADVVLSSVQRAWRRMKGRRWETAWRDDVGPRVNTVIQAGQAAAAARSSQYVAEVLAELEIQVAADTKFLSDSFTGVAGDGRAVASLTYGSVIATAKAQYAPGMSDLSTEQILRESLAAGEAFVTAATDSVLADTARAAEVAAIAQRPWLTGYIRMLDPKNPCSRCVVLAGKFYLHNAGFARHPRCRCVHIPYAENRPHDVLTNPNDYFASLSKAEQDRVFTAAGAEAVRLGADVSQVVNARRGMTTAQQNPRGWIPKGRLIPTDVFGRPTYTTTEGVTKHGKGRKAMGTGRPVRLMPESIVSIATDKADAIRLLKLYGYIT